MSINYGGPHPYTPECPCSECQDWKRSRDVRHVLKFVCTRCGWRVQAFSSRPECEVCGGRLRFEKREEL